MTRWTQPAPSWRKPLLTVHIVVSVSAIGAAVVLLALGISGLRDADPQTVYPAAHLVERWVIAPLALLALGTGVVLAVTLPGGLARQWWVVVKLAITAGLTVVVFLVLEPALAATADVATGRSAGSLTDAQRTRTALAPAVATVLLVLNVVLGVYRPARRLRPGRTEGRTSVAAR